MLSIIKYWAAEYKIFLMNVTASENIEKFYDIITWKSMKLLDILMDTKYFIIHLNMKNFLQNVWYYSLETTKVCLAMTNYKMQY